MIKGERRDGEQLYDDTEREIIRAVTELDALRRGRAQPARVPHLGRPRGRAARADPRAGAALAQPGAAQGGGRGAREPRRDRVAPQAPAAGPRPAQARALTLDLDALHPATSPTSRSRGSCSRTSRRCSSTRRRCEHAIDALADYARAREVDYVVAAEARGFVLGGAVAAAAGAGLHPRAQAGQAAARGRLGRVRSSSTASTRSRCTPTRVRGGARVLVHDDLLATGGTAAALCELVEQAGGVVAGCAFVIELAFLGGPRAAGAATTSHSLSCYDVGVMRAGARRCVPRPRRRGLAAW